MWLILLSVSAIRGAALILLTCITNTATFMEIIKLQNNKLLWYSSTIASNQSI
jgi:hypothetical protein